MQINRKKQGNNDQKRLKTSDFKKIGAKSGGGPMLKPTDC